MIFGGWRRRPVGAARCRLLMVARVSGPVAMLEGKFTPIATSCGSRGSGIGSVVVGQGEGRAVAQGVAGDGAGVALVGA